MTMKRAEVKTRLLEFADFLEVLPEHKFNHGSWFDPDFTCKSSACTAGWAAILYRSTAKRYVDKQHEIQRLQHKFDETKDNLEKKELERQIIKLGRNQEEPDWSGLGKNALGLDQNEVYILFSPGNQFWDTAPKEGFQGMYVAPKVMALTIRYLAYLPLNRFPFKANFYCDIKEKDKYNEKFMLNYIAEQKAKETQSDSSLTK